MNNNFNKIQDILQKLQKNIKNEDFDISDHLAMLNMNDEEIDPIALLNDHKNPSN